MDAAIKYRTAQVCIEKRLIEARVALDPRSQVVFMKRLVNTAVVM